jgi:aspartate racemase
VYQSAAAALGQRVIETPQELARKMESVILEELIRGVVSQAAVETMTSAANHFVFQGADCIVLDCTDLTHAAGQLQAQGSLPIFDSTILHAEAAAAAACGQEASMKYHSSFL